MFEQISNGLNTTFNKIKGKSQIGEDDIDTAMREIRIALLEADVALPVIKSLTKTIKEKSLGAEVIKSIAPGQMIVKIIHNEIIKILGGIPETDSEEINSLDLIKNIGETKATSQLNLKNSSIIMLVGLQGSGKTTSAAKLALFLRKRYKKNPILISTDIYRPAAQLQLENLAKQIDIASLEIVTNEKPLQIIERAKEKIKQHDVLIIDTAGRLQTDSELMLELQEIKKSCNPDEIILVADSMLGQESVNIAKEFDDSIDISGIILTRVDGDARGGAALSMKYVTGKPIKFVGVGEKISEFDEFYPERAASRILGMGDIISLVEKAGDVIETKEMEQLQKKIENGQLDMNDLLSQLQNIKKIGSFGSIMAMIPGLGKIKDKIGDSINDKMLKKQEAIIQSMTIKERKLPTMINSNRKKRIAAGSGSAVSDVNILLKRFNEMTKMMKKMGKMDPSKIQNMMKLLK